MDLAKFTIAEISILLGSKSIQQDIVDNLAGENICKMKIMIIKVENLVDGVALICLVNDFQEFQNLVPQCIYRMKIKNVIQELYQVFYLINNNSLL